MKASREDNIELPKTSLGVPVPRSGYGAKPTVASTLGSEHCGEFNPERVAAEAVRSCHFGSENEAMAG